MNALKKWMASASVEEKQRLAKFAGLTRAALQWAAGGYRTAGKANVAPEVARRLEIASAKLAREGLPVLPRESLCQACARCELARAAREAGV